MRYVIVQVGRLEGHEGFKFPARSRIRSCSNVVVFRKASTATVIFGTTVCNDHTVIPQRPLLVPNASRQLRVLGFQLLSDCQVGVSR